MNASVFRKPPLCIKKKKKQFILRDKLLGLAFITTALFSFTFPSHSHTTAQCFQLLKTIFSPCYLLSDMCSSCAWSFSFFKITAATGLRDM